MTERRARLARALPYVVSGIVAAFLYYTAVQFDFHHRPGTLGPDAWPKGISLLMLVVSLYKVGELLFGRARVPGPYETLESAEDGGNAEAPQRYPLLLLLGVAATLAYVALVTTLGFFLCTATYLAAFLWIGGYRRRWIIAVTSLAGALLLMFIFMKLVYVSLPIGTPPFSAVTFALMQLMGIR